MVDEDRHLGNSAKNSDERPARRNPQLRTRSNCQLTGRHIPGSTRMLGVFGQCMSLKTSRVVCLVVSPMISHLSTICPDCKPLLLGLDPQGLVRIC
jgi:hypothetical protein